MSNKINPEVLRHKMLDFIQMEIIPNLPQVVEQGLEKFQHDKPMVAGMAVPLLRPFLPHLLEYVQNSAVDLLETISPESIERFADSIDDVTKWIKDDSVQLHDIIPELENTWDEKRT